MSSRLSLVAAALLLPACAADTPVSPEVPPPSLRAEIEVLFKGWFQLNPPPAGIMNACTGERVIMSGEYNLIVRSVTSSSGRTQFRVHSQANIKGIGATSGTEYVATDIFNLTETSGPDGHLVSHIAYPLRTISKGSQDNVAGHIYVQFTINANGEVTVNREEFVFDVCHG